MAVITVSQVNLMPGKNHCNFPGDCEWDPSNRAFPLNVEGLNSPLPRHSETPVYTEWDRFELKMAPDIKMHYPEPLSKCLSV